MSDSPKNLPAGKTNSVVLTEGPSRAAARSYFRAVIAPSFADIFFSNAGKNGIILAPLTDAEVETLIQRSTANPKHLITINLEQQTVTDNEGFSAHFDIDPFRKHCLLNGLDDIGLTLLHAEELTRYEAKHNNEFWLAPKAQATA